MFRQLAVWDASLFITGRNVARYGECLVSSSLPIYNALIVVINLCLSILL